MTAVAPAEAAGSKAARSAPALARHSPVRTRMSARLSIRESFRARSSSIEFLLTEVRSAFDPNATAIQTWHQLLLIALIYEIVMLPFIATFRSSMSQWLAPELMGIYACELLFYADVYIELNTGYYEDGNVMMDAKKSRVKYFKSPRFVLDVLALPPLSLVYPAVRNRLRFAPIFLEFHKFLRIWRLPKYVAMLDDIYARQYVLLKMFKVLLVILMLSHYVACFRFLFGYDEDHNDHWLPHKPRSDEELQQHSPYLMSLFWAFGLLTGLFEGELPTTIFEFLFTIFVGLCGFSMFTYVCATFFMISKCESGHSETSEARINQLKHLLSFHRVPEQLQVQATEYLKRYYTQSESNDREAVRLLCPSIVKDIQVELLKDMVGSILFFKDCNQQFIIAVTSLLELISLPASVVVFNMGDEGDAMYFVNSGVLQVIVNGIKIREVRKGAFFGEMALFLNRPRYATVVTSTYCTLYKLVRFHVERLFEGYPQYASVVPKRVAEMAQALFGRVSGEALIIPDQSVIDQSSEKKKSEGKKLFANIIRMHMKKDKNKVTPTGETHTGPVGTDNVDGSISSVSLSPMMLLAAQALKKSRTTSEPPEPAKSVGEDLVSSHDTVSQKPIADSNGARPISEVATTMRRSTVTRVSTAITDIYGHLGLKASRTKTSYWWSRFLLSTAIDNDSKRRLWWLIMLQGILIYNWFLIPLQLAFLAFQHNTWYVVGLNVITDLLLWADIFVNFNLSFVEDSEKIWDTTRTAIRYIKGWFLADVVCVFPFWFFAQKSHHALPRLPRLLRIARLRGHLQEIDEFVKLNSKQRLMLFGILLVVLYHIVACLHFSISYVEGFSRAYHAWIPSDDVSLVAVNSTHCRDVNGDFYLWADPHVTAIGVIQYFRSLYYATNVLAALGLTIEPSSDVQYGLALLFMLSGFFITAIVVDNVQKRFTASAFEQKEFFATRSQIQLFLRRQNAPLIIHKRVNAFLDYWWSSHRGAVISELLDELPETIKLEILQNICQPALQTLALLNGVRPVLSDLENVFLGNARFILYGQGEIVYRQGDYASGLFFLLSGEVCIIANGGAPRSVHQGGFFGTAALQLEGSAVSYTERVTATSGSMVLFVSRQHIRAMKSTYTSLEDSLKALERRFLDPKLAKASQLQYGVGFNDSDERRSWRKWFSCFGDDDRIFDPDSLQMMAWETWLFIIMTVEWVLIMFHICFGVSDDKAAVTDAILMVIELHFMIDIYVRSHLGYLEFGNRVMVPKQIRRRYIRSHEFAIDIIALVPLFMVNWGLPSVKRNEVFNLNKLIRLTKVPMQFTALENKYIKRTFELRLFKLVYYTFLLSHMFGCIWFDFGSNASGLHTLISDERANSTEDSGFGANPWMPPLSLKNADASLQYFASIFWSFALMSASNTGELPKTVSQSFFSVITMTSGFFLFAYVIGNFADTIELMDAENREFYSRLNSLRHLITHFKLPAPIAVKFKNYYFFKRFHSITQEHLLERCLPPSLLTDIRMVHLQPMIEKVTFLSGMDASVTRMLVSQFNQVLIVKDEFVYKFGEEGSDMYFVFTGVLCTLLPQEEFARESSIIERKAPVKTLPQRHSGGLPSLIHQPTLRPTSQLTKFNEVTAGNYFGENALFVNSIRTSYVQASTSCILYSLSRNSLELVFERYPDWKEKVLRIVTINQEQRRLNRMAEEEEKQGNIINLVAKVDQLNAKAERTEVEVLAFRRMKSVAAKRNSSQAASALLASGLDRIQESRFVPTRWMHMPHWLNELVQGTTAQSWYHLCWLKLVTLATIYVAIVVPYRISFDSLLRPRFIPVFCRELELLCEFIFIWDMWFNWRLKGSHDSMELYEQDHRRSYKKERLKWDLLAAFPLDYLLYSLSPSPWFRINRCFKVRNLVHYMQEINRRSISNEMKRLRITCLTYILVIYWSACSYFVIAIYDRYGQQWNAWLPSVDLEITRPQDPPSEQLTLRLLRGLFFATTAFVKKGRTFTPESTPHFVFAIITCFVGLMVMAYMLGEIASLFISFIGNEVEYRKNHIAVELYLGRWKIQGDLRTRTQAFLSSLWSSHRGVDYQSLLEEVPVSIRTESVLNIARWPLKQFTSAIFRPICGGNPNDPHIQSSNIDLLMRGLAQRLKFEGYPRDERVLVEGSIAKSMFFVVRGHLRSASRSHTAQFGQLSFVKGDYFGEHGLLGYSVSAFTVSTMRACDLLSLSAEDLLDVLHSHPTFSLALKVADRASEKMRVLPLASNMRTMEIRWGQMLIDAVNEERILSEAPTTDGMSRRAAKKTRATLDRVFVTRTSDECYSSFRSFLQIIVPNGFVHLHGTPTLTKQTSSNRVSSSFDTRRTSGSQTLMAPVPKSRAASPKIDGALPAAKDAETKPVGDQNPLATALESVPSVSRLDSAHVSSGRTHSSHHQQSIHSGVGDAEMMQTFLNQSDDAPADDKAGPPSAICEDSENLDVPRNLSGPSLPVLTARSSIRSIRSPSPGLQPQRRSLL